MGREEVLPVLGTDGKWMIVEVGEREKGSASGEHGLALAYPLGIWASKSEHLNILDGISASCVWLISRQVGVKPDLPSACCYFFAGF